MIDTHQLYPVGGAGCVGSVTVQTEPVGMPLTVWDCPPLSCTLPLAVVVVPILQV